MPYNITSQIFDAESDYSSVVSIVVTGVQEEEIPTEYSIIQNYPNPFNATTKIRLALPKTILTKIPSYDLLGREIKTLVNEKLPAGFHEINIDSNHKTLDFKKYYDYFSMS